MKHLNSELKARYDSPDRARQILLFNGAECKGLDHQVDTYFTVPSGRLKLREGNIEHSLIYYERANYAEAKQSRIILYESPKPELKEILMKCLGVLAVVDKQREIYFIDNVKFHIDNVKGLGNFVEIEAIESGERFTYDYLRNQCFHYQSLLGIRTENLISCSYSDMLLGR